MITFMRLLTDDNKASSLLRCCSAIRTGVSDASTFQVAPESFRAVPGAAFAYWVSDDLRAMFSEFPQVEGQNRVVKVGVQTFDDTRFVRTSWELPFNADVARWVPYVKGGAWSPFYSDVFLKVNFARDGLEMSEFKYMHRPREGRKHRACEFYFHPGLTWPRRTQGGLSLRVMPPGCIFADKGPTVFVADDSPADLFALLALANSKAFSLMVSLQMAFGSYEVGVIQKTPVPPLDAEERRALSLLARRAWLLKHRLDSVEETSHAFVLPAALRPRLGDFDPEAIESELLRIQSEIDAVSFSRYGFSAADREVAVLGSRAAVLCVGEDRDSADLDDETDEIAESVDHTAGLLSWALGVAFGRFDWRLANGQRSAPLEPEPFDPLPALSPGMLPVDCAQFHTHAGILVDDPGHRDDLARLLEEVLARVDAPMPFDVRRWLRRECFELHLKRYSKSRRKAPIYWPLLARSGNYTLWLYYPTLNDQTLYAAVNNFVDPRLRQVASDLAALRAKGAARNRDDEGLLEAGQELELELIELRDTLLKLAPTYKPKRDDGVQMNAAPLWSLFRHKPWQKVLKETWVKLEEGDCDWAHLAMNYWPDRVREKCKTDKSLAIAHGLEHLYVEPAARAKRNRGRRKAGDAE